MQQPTRNADRAGHSFRCRCDRSTFWASVALTGSRLTAHRRALRRKPLHSCLFVQREMQTLVGCYSVSHGALEEAADVNDLSDVGDLSDLSGLRQRWGLDSLTAADLQQLQSGNLVQKQVREGPTGSGVVVIDVNAPASLVLKCLESFEDYPEFIPVVRRAEVLSRSSMSAEGTVLTRLRYRVSKFWLDMPVRHLVDKAKGIVCFDLDRSSCKLVLQEACGFWHVEEAPGVSGEGCSRVWLRARLVASSLLPHWIVNYAADRALRRASSWLKPYVETLWQERQRGRPWRSQQREGAPFDIQMSSALQLRPSVC